jgi:hypothetical protein
LDHVAEALAMNDEDPTADYAFSVPLRGLEAALKGGSLLDPVTFDFRPRCR